MLFPHSAKIPLALLFVSKNFQCNVLGQGYYETHLKTRIHISFSLIFQQSGPARPITPSTLVTPWRITSGFRLFLLLRLYTYLLVYFQTQQLSYYPSPPTPSQTRARRRRCNSAGRFMRVLFLRTCILRATLFPLFENEILQRLRP